MTPRYPGTVWSGTVSLLLGGPLPSDGKQQELPHTAKCTSYASQAHSPCHSESIIHKRSHTHTSAQTQVEPRVRPNVTE